MKYPVSSIWKDFYLERDAGKDIRACIERGLQRSATAVRDAAVSGTPLQNTNSKNENASGVKIFFRADDIGVPSRNFSRLTALFSRFEIPLALAVVPTWITRSRWEIIENETSGKTSLWCWHHHGWRHMNHERTGKKQEFGPSRSVRALKYDLERGKQRLESILGKAFFPMFTPPWNRCSSECMELLMKLEYQGISRFQNAKPITQESFPDLQMNVDLHTLKASNPVSEWSMLMSQLENGIAVGRCGIMIHHQRMNGHAFEFLELFFQELLARKLSVLQAPSMINYLSR